MECRAGWSRSEVVVSVQFTGERKCASGVVMGSIFAFAVNTLATHRIKAMRDFLTFSGPWGNEVGSDEGREHVACGVPAATLLPHMIL